jgi:phosphoglycolate phosphatase-like HAD superfamily hydrolase
MNKKIILFDWDDTLFSKSGYQKRLSETLAKVCNLPAETVWKLEEEYFNGLDKSGDFRVDKLLEFVRQKSGKQVDLTNFIASNPEIYSGALFPEIVTVLDQLKEKFLLGIYSQGFIDLQKTKIEYSGIKNYFDEKLIYLNNNKLDSDFIKTLPNKVMLVDDKKEVIETLKQLRPDLELVWINRKDEEKTDGVRTIQSLKELL